MLTEDTRALDTADLVRALDEVGEWFGAGYLSRLDAGPIIRLGAALRHFLEHVPLPEYTGRRLYPHGGSLYGAGQAFWHHYVQASYDRGLWERKRVAAETDAQRAALDQLDAVCRAIPYAGGYTHSIVHYGRVLREGLAHYERRIRRHLATAAEQADPARVELYEALLEVLAGAECFRQRCLARIREATLTSPEAEANRTRLVAALSRVPWEPAHTFDEAMVAVNWLFYFDGSDDLGRFDQDVRPYYEASQPEDESASAAIGELWRNVDDCFAWNAALGGTTRDGRSGYSHLTELCLRAGKGRRRPNMALRIRADMPDEVWDAALDCISGGSGIPALYCEENYLAALREAHLNVSREDLHDFAFGGCTETMIHGRSNVGSLDDVINLPKVLETALHAELPGCADYAAFEQQVREHLAAEVRRIADSVSANQQRRAEHLPQLIRTLLIDDCIDNGREYAAGGARYNWSVINVEGLGNLIDSLTAVRHLVYEAREVSPAELLHALQNDWAEQELLRRRCERLPRYGNGHPEVDALAQRLSAFIFREFLSYAPWRGGKFLPSCLMFVTYANEGRPVGATPDGRSAGSPIADSAGAVQGRDRSGPTAALQSAAALDTVHAPGTLVVNIRLSRKLFDQRDKVKALVRGYFALGGLQVQINVVDQAVLRDALEHPERHGDLIIRMGGYSEYWTQLSRELRESVLERVEHT